MTPEEPADIAADETEEHVDVDSDPATQQGLVTQEHQDGRDQEQQGDDVANITEHQHIRPYIMKICMFKKKKMTIMAKFF